MLPNSNQSPNVVNSSQIFFFQNLASFFSEKGNIVTEYSFFIFIFGILVKFPPQKKERKELVQ